jgi:hypothetical protein
VLTRWRAVTLVATYFNGVASRGRRRGGARAISTVDDIHATLGAAEDYRIVAVAVHGRTAPDAIARVLGIGPEIAACTCCLWRNRRTLGLSSPRRPLRFYRIVKKASDAQPRSAIALPDTFIESRRRKTVMGTALVKSDAILYGTFINVAYTMYDAAGSSLTPTQPKSFPAGYEMTAWIQMSDFAFLGKKERKFYGFIARETSNHQSHIIVIRGTEGTIEWYDDAVCLPRKFTPVPIAGSVSAGFDDIYTSMQVVRCPRPEDIGTSALPQVMTGSFADQVEQLLSMLPVTSTPAPAGAQGLKHNVVVTGHSLGGALCTLYAMEHAVRKRADPKRAVVLDRICTFASPRVGMEPFVTAFDALPIDSWRIVNTQDIVPKVPPSVPLLLPYRHVDTEYAFSSSGVTKFTPACWHSMDTYLNWLDPTLPLDRTCTLP